jgi:alpha-tubulin suppressor-like RCC1 family protein
MNPIPPKQVKLRTDDGVETVVYVWILDYFPPLFTMIDDVGPIDADTVLEMHDGFGTSTRAVLRETLDFYKHFDPYITNRNMLPAERASVRRNARPAMKDMDVFFRRTSDLDLHSMAAAKLTALLALNQFAHYNDSRPLEVMTQLFLIWRMVKGEHEMADAVPLQLLMPVEDVPIWSQRPLLARYLLAVMPYARRYRHNLTIVRSVIDRVRPDVLRFLVRPAASPVVCGPDYTMIVTPLGLFACGRNHNGLMHGIAENEVDTFKEVMVRQNGAFIDLACGDTDMMMLTTQGLFLGSVMRQCLCDFYPVSFSNNGGSQFWIDIDGRLASRGANNYGQLGHGDVLAKPQFTYVQGIGTPLVVHTRNASTFVITTVGLYATGYNNSGQLGFGDTLDRVSFERVKVPGTPLQIALGSEHCFLLTTEGLFATGFNGSGQLGLGVFTNRTHFTLVQINGMPLSMACGVNHTMVITSEGLFGCGHGRYGIGSDTITEQFTRITIEGVPISVACGSEFTMLLTTAGLFSAGSTANGQLGLGTVTTAYVESFTRVQVPGLPLKSLLRQTPELADEGGEKKRPRLGCRVCNLADDTNVREKALPDRVFCQGLCQRKFHYFAQLGQYF